MFHQNKNLEMSMSYQDKFSFHSDIKYCFSNLENLPVNNSEISYFLIHELLVFSDQK